MIFDNEYITRLVKRWKETDDIRVLEEIVNKSKPLARVIVCRYPIEYREDMFQECLARIAYALEHYNPQISNLHPYFTSVFVNRCNTYIGKESRQQRLSEILEDMYSPTIFTLHQKEEFLHDLLERNRVRFPSIPADKLDDASCYVFDCIVNGIRGKSRGAIASLMRIYGFKRPVALVLYHSSLVYMRQRYENFVSYEVEEPKEFTLLPELKGLLGDEAYRRIFILFSGLHFRIP